MSSDISGHLSDKPDGKTAAAKVTNDSLLPGQITTQTPTFISGSSDKGTFLACIWASCPSSLTAQKNGEKLMAVALTVNDFRDVAR
jgi:hypothetical protein